MILTVTFNPAIDKTCLLYTSITSAVIIFFFIHHEMKKLDVQIAQETGEELGVYSETLA